ncbi:MAG: FecR domain-containing protein [Deltaproteobacteria bacterium]|nr:FecR domain-containing protein [Deltaproteobacteria bacterium]
MNFNSKIIIIPFLASLLFLSPSFASNKKQPVGAVVAWTGDVYLYHEDEPQGIKVRGMEGVYLRDTIVTSVKSRVKLLMKDDSVLNLGENAKMVVKDYLLSEANDQRVSVFKIFAGKVRALVGRVFRGSEARFQMETPTAAAWIKGTDFIVAANERESEIATITGEVEARNISPSISGEVIVKPGFVTKVQEGNAPTEPAEIPPQRLNELIEETSIPVTVPIEMKESGCIGCHENVYSSIIRYSKQHPRSSDECQMCHITDLAPAREIPVDTFTRENLIYLDVADIVNYRVKVKVKDREGREAVSREIGFAPSSINEALMDDKKPPLISNVRVEEIKAGIFYSAVLTWETDEPSTSQVEYGLSSKYGEVSPPDNRYTKEHKAIIDRLVPDEKYHIRAISKDPFGNAARSDDFIFKAKKPFVEKQDEPQNKPSVDDIKVVKIGGETALWWKTNKKTTSVVEVAEVISRKNIVSKEPHYPGLTTMKYAGLDGCLSEGCHKGSIHKKTAHPTGSLSWMKVTPPADLPLAGGAIMLCSTCHSPHGGNYDHILRKEESKLCTSCHREQR